MKDTLKTIATCAGALTILVGAFALLGWVLDVEWMKGLATGHRAMNPASAVCFIFSGVALMVYSLKRSNIWARRFVKVVGAFVCLAGANCVLAVTGNGFEIDQILFHSTLRQNHMAPNTAFCFVFVGLSFLFTTSRKLSRRRFADFTNTILLAMCILTLACYLYGTEAFSGFVRFVPMALNASIDFFILSVGIFALRPTEGVAAVFTASDLGGQAARRLMPIVVVTPLALGALRIFGQNQNWYDFNFGASLLVVFTIYVLAYLVWSCAKYLGNVDRAVQRQRRFVESILTSIGDAVVVIDASNRVSMFNRSAEEMIEIERYNSDRETWSQTHRLSREGAEPRISLPLDYLLRSDEDGKSEFLFEKKPFGNRYLSITGRPVVTVDGNVLGRVAVFRDVTQSKVSAQVLKNNNQILEERIQARMNELNQAQSQIEQLQKLDAVGRLAGGIAHDFNNILGAIQMYCELSARKLDDQVVIQDGIRQIEKATERGAALTRQLLIFSRKKIAETRPVNLNELLSEHFKMLTRLIGENVQTELKLAADIPSILADPGQIEQVIMNLVINARDAMLSGGKLTVETKIENLDEEFVLKHLSSKTGTHVVLSITDTGCGMDEKTREQIFEPFFTTKPVGQGTGLGLSTVYGIVKSLEGTVWVFTEVGRGSVFKVYIPVSEEALFEHVQEPNESRLEGSEKLLLVEDDAQLLRLYDEALTAFGYEVIPAKNGVNALEIFLKLEPPPDLVVTDLIMPEMGGGQLIEKIWAQAPNTKILCISGYPGDNTEIEAIVLGRDSGRVGYLQKPFKTAALITRIREILNAAG